MLVYWFECLLKVMDKIVLNQLRIMCGLFCLIPIAKKGRHKIILKKSVSNTTSMETVVLILLLEILVMGLLPDT